MFIKIHDKPSGIPAAQATVTAAEEEDSNSWVVLRMQSLDSWHVPHIAATLRLTPREAREIALRLIQAADATVPK